MVVVIEEAGSPSMLGALGCLAKEEAGPLKQGVEPLPH